VASLKGSDSVTTHLLELPDWPPASAESCVRPLTKLASRLDELQDGCLSPGPVAVHCSDAGSGSSVVVALSILMRQFGRERRVDVFQTVRRLRSQRQGMLQQMAHYDLLYRCMVEHAALSESNGSALTG